MAESNRSGIAEFGFGRFAMRLSVVHSATDSLSCLPLACGVHIFELISPRVYRASEGVGFSAINDDDEPTQGFKQ